MTNPEKRLIRERLAIAFDLYETAEQLVAQRFRRENPGASPEEVENRIREWLQTRPGAEQGDAEGRPVVLPDNE